MIIDTHQHFWIYNEEKHSWIDDAMKKIRRDFLPENLKVELDRNSVDGCIAVQADQTEEENDFLLDLAEKYDFIKGIIGWVDFRSPKINERLAYYAAFDKMKGFRHVVQGEADINFLLRKDFMKGISQLSSYGFCYEILVFPHQLGAVLEFVKKFPNQKFVIDHIGKPYIKDGFYEGWALMMNEIGKHENVYCKVSGMVTEADYQTWNYQQIEPYTECVLESFGSKRIMYGSDWPVCLVAGSYKEVKSIPEKFVEQLPVEEQKDFWCNNAIEFYNI